MDEMGRERMSDTSQMGGVGDVTGELPSGGSTAHHSPHPRARRSSGSNGTNGRRGGRPLLAPGWFTNLPTWARVAIIVPVALVALFFLAALGDVLLSWGRIHPRVSVGEVPVGGMTQVRAVEVLDESYSASLEETVVVVHDELSWEYSAADLGAEMQYESCAEAAYAVGRTGSLLDRITARASAWFSGDEVDACVAGDPALMQPAFDAMAAAVHVPPVDAMVTIEGTEVIFHESAVGSEMDREVAEFLVLQTFVADERTVELPMRHSPVTVSDADAQQAFEDAKLMIAAPLELTHEDQNWTIEPETLGSWIGFRQLPPESLEGTATEATTSPQASAVATTGADGSEETTSPVPGRMVLYAHVLPEPLADTVEPLTGEVGREPKDATFRTGGGTVSIVPGEVGLGLDAEGLALTLDQVLREEESGKRTALLRMQTIEPDLTTEEAEAMGINERISTYTTTFSSGNRPRVNNIQTLARALDGTLIPPGGEFSFNEAAGPRTADRGYQEAGTIVNGRLVPTLGGGICQVGTTMFNTVFFAGLPVVERRNHSFYISHYPAGRDATISWGGPDLRFKNETSAWMLVSTSSGSGSVTISLYGTDPGYEVDYTTGQWTGVKAHGTQETEDPSLPEGTRVIEDSGVDGRSIKVTRRVTKGGQLVREDTFSSRYNPKTEIVRVGTKPAPSVEATASAAATTTP
jgi:vancomycin resistance protein YoaR